LSPPVVDYQLVGAINNLNKKAARVEVNISLAFLHWVGIALHPDLSSLI